MNYFEYHIGDYIKSTAHLSMLEDASYRRLIDAYYTREAPLPVDQKACQRLARARSKDECAAVDLILDEFFVLQSDGWHQKRCDEEIARFKAKSLKAKASADARWGNPPSDENANAMRTHMPTHSEGNATCARPSNQKPVTILPSEGNISPPRTPRSKGKTPLPADFAVSERVMAWAAENAFDRLDAHLEHFVGYARANGKTYTDWDQALMNAIRGDWAKLKTNGRATPDYERAVAHLPGD